eukprot:475679-Pelagomonas_calceolata.AAC.1
MQYGLHFQRRLHLQHQEQRIQGQQHGGTGGTPGAAPGGAASGGAALRSSSMEEQEQHQEEQHQVEQHYGAAAWRNRSSTRWSSIRSSSMDEQEQHHEEQHSGALSRNRGDKSPTSLPLVHSNPANLPRNASPVHASAQNIVSVLLCKNRAA